MKLYTRTGDAGETSLFDGSRVPKDHPRIAAAGDVDELNSVLGWCRCADQYALIAERIEQVQNDLFVIGSELATPAESSAAGRIPRIAAQAAERLEGWIDDAVSPVPPLRQFILPGGTELASRLHLARTVCRRAERGMMAMARGREVRAEILVYLNRLSDLLFAWGRLANHAAAVPELPWGENRR